MGAWKGIYMGLQDAEASKERQKQLDMEQRRLDLADKQQALENKFRFYDLMRAEGLLGGGFDGTAGSGDGAGGVDPRAAAAGTEQFLSRFTDEALSNYNEDERKSLQKYADTIAQDPIAASKVNDLILASEKSTGIALSPKDVTKFITVVSVGKTSPRKVADLMGSVFGTDIPSELATRIANTDIGGRVSVNFTPNFPAVTPVDTKVQSAQVDAYDAQLIYLINSGALGSTQDIAALGNGMKSSDPLVRADARMKITSAAQKLDPNYITALEESNPKVFAGISTNPLIRPTSVLPIPSAATPTVGAVSNMTPSGTPGPVVPEFMRQGNTSDIYGTNVTQEDTTWGAAP